MLRLFQDNFIFGKGTSSHYFLRVTTSTQKLHSRSSYFFKAVAFFSFFRTVTFSQQLFLLEQLLFQNENFTELPILENEKFFMAVTFRNSCFSLFRIKLPKKELLFQGRYFYTVSTFPEKLHFGKS